MAAAWTRKNNIGSIIRVYKKSEPDVLFNKFLVNAFFSRCFGLPAEQPLQNAHPAG
jgi:hypothetical protein